MEYYKFLNKDGSACHGGSGKWHLPRGKRPGRWMPAVEVIPCKSGYHLCRPKDLLSWLAPALWIAEGRGQMIECDDKVVFEQARLLRPVEYYSEAMLRRFAADIQAARDFANGKIGADQWAAARAAARAAAQAASWYAALDAARDAAWDAARVAEREWQTQRLLQYLRGENVEPWPIDESGCK